MSHLRAGLSGCGAAGREAVRAVRQHSDCEFVALHDPDPAALRALQQETGITTTTTDFAALLATGIDLVVLAGPPGVRAQQVRLAAEQSVHCLLHAPMAPTLEEARAMLAVADAGQIKLGVAVRGQEDPVLEQVRRMVAADWFGGVVCVQALWSEDELLRGAASPADWRLQPVLAGRDPLLRLAAHHVHLAAWLTGRPALSVTAQATSGLLPLPHDSAVATAVLRGNVVCSFTASHLCRARSFAIAGTDGALRLEGDRVWLCGRRPFAGDVFDYPDPGADSVFERSALGAAIGRHGPACELHGRFARWIDDLDDFPCTGEQAIADLRVLEAMARAAASGHTERV